MRLFELCDAEERVFFSPYVWRAKFCLAHKGISATTEPWHFVEKDKIAPSGSKAVPVVEAGGEWVADSWKIACWLEEKYPDAPSLFGGAMGKAQARFISLWADRNIIVNLFPMLAADVNDVLTAEDQVHFRRTREQALGRTLEEARDGREAQRPVLMKALGPLMSMLKEQPFICGDAPGFADYACYAPFVWAECISSFPVTEPHEDLDAWMDRLESMFDGLAAKAPRAA